MGLILDVYKSSGRSFSNGGFSERVDEVTVVNVGGPFEPNEERPAALLLAGNTSDSVKVVPALKVRTGYVPLEAKDALGQPGVGPMFGGTFVGTSDSRFSEAIRAILGRGFYGAVAFHDRFETNEQYRALSL